MRQIKCEVGVLPRTHGSALFTRGETQALVVTTLGMSEDEQRLESLDGHAQIKFYVALQFSSIFSGRMWKNRHRQKRDRSW